MKRGLTGQQAELFQRIDEVLFYLWDPIGVSDEHDARDEYDSYVGPIFSMVHHGKSPEAIGQELTRILSESFEIEITDEIKSEHARLASLMIKCRDIVSSRS